MSEESTRHRILTAARELISEAGLRGATTRRVAERAGVNEVTIFRTFGSKGELVAEVMRGVAERVAEVGSTPSGTGELRSTLTTLASNYGAVVVEHRQAFSRLIPEVRADDELRALIQPVLREVAQRVVCLFEHYRDAGELVDDVPEALALAFVGPLMARAMVGDVLGIEPEFAPDTYVARYLEGYGAS